MIGDALFLGVYVEEIGQERQDAVNEETKGAGQTAAGKAAMAEANVGN
jgi:hypothetical protein